jgi:hypothetical protein
LIQAADRVGVGYANFDRVAGQKIMAIYGFQKFAATFPPRAISSIPSPSP